MEEIEKTKRGTMGQEHSLRSGTPFCWRRAHTCACTFAGGMDVRGWGEGAQNHYAMTRCGLCAAGIKIQAHHVKKGVCTWSVPPQDRGSLPPLARKGALSRISVDHGADRIWDSHGYNP